MICNYPGCGEDTKPIRGQERITHRPVWICGNCGGRVPQPSERGRKPRSPRRPKK